MNRERTTAFSALQTLDPLRSVPPEEGGWPRAQAGGAADEVELQIARILAAPRHDATDRGVVRALPGPAGPRYGVLGLLASATVAVIATLLWVSPSAGEPIGQMGAAPAVAHHDGMPRTTVTATAPK